MVCGRYHADSHRLTTAPALNGSAPASTAHAGASVLDQLFSSVWGGSNAPVEYCPRAGQLVLFPSWLQHSVRPYREQNQRNGGGKALPGNDEPLANHIQGHGIVVHWPHCVGPCQRLVPPRKVPPDTALARTAPPASWPPLASAPRHPPPRPACGAAVTAVEGGWRQIM